jgi:hypothetical protein
VPILNLSFKWLLASALTSLPSVILFALPGGIPGVLAGWIVGISATVILGFFPERILARLHRAKFPQEPGLERSLSRVGGPAHGSFPRVLVFPDPAINVLVARSLGSSGSILVSQGLLNAAGEEDLRDILAESLQRIEKPEILLRSYCAMMACAVLELAPQSWVRAALGGMSGKGKSKESGPLSFLGFIMAFPVARAWMQLGGADSSADAMQKVARKCLFWDLKTNPGASSLYLQAPWKRTRILGFPSA